MPAVSNLDSVRNILLALQKCWSDSGDSEAIRASHLLKSALGDETTEVPHLPTCSPPSGLCLAGKDGDDLKLFTILFQCWNGLGWTVAPQFKLTPDLEHKIKEARLIGPYGPIKSNKIDVKISVVVPHTLVPRHSEEAAEILQILEGDSIQIGLAVDDWLERKKYNYFPPTHPKVVKTLEDQFVAISVHIGKLNGKLWLNDEDTKVGGQYLGITECKNNVEDYFDNVANDYERAMRTWGYCMPEMVSSALIEHGRLQPGNAKILDLGCGDGAIGVALKDKGFTNISGIDISGGMLSVAKQRGVYRELKKGNLLHPLPFDDKFDCAVTSAVTTYLEPAALKVWLPVVKKGGLICIVHKASVWPKWVPEQERLETSKAWKMVWQTKEDVPYLPSLECRGTDRGRMYIYEKL